MAVPVEITATGQAEVIGHRCSRGGSAFVVGVNDGHEQRLITDFASCHAFRKEELFKLDSKIKISN